MSDHAKPRPRSLLLGIDAGGTKTEAVLASGRLRFRPIVLTSVTTMPSVSKLVSMSPPAVNRVKPKLAALSTPDVSLDDTFFVRAGATY